ncbi:MAG: methionine aminotransferase [Bacteroidetes bacterium]|nr:methionine aminotransferase [Bacteroidota bacterium]
MKGLNIESKLPDAGTSIFTVMSKMAQEHNAINLSQGFPDFPCSEDLVRLVNENMVKGLNQYAPMAGVPELGETISNKIEKLYEVIYDPETEITVTAGATEALYSAISAIIHHGDEVIVFEPAYDCYTPTIELNGGVPVRIRMNSPDFEIDWVMVENLINTKTKMIIINTPHNPTGTILSEKDMLELQRITDDTNIVVLSDEVYEHIIFDLNVHQSVISYPNLAARSFAVFSFGKLFHTTGWKLGYCVAPKELMKAFRKVHQFIVFTCNTPIQYALAEFLKKEEEYLSIAQLYQDKRDFFVDAIEDSGFKIIPSFGTYFQLLDYSDISEENDFDYAATLIKTIGVASIPVSSLYSDPPDNKLLRFCFAKSNETLEKAAKKLCSL